MTLSDLSIAADIVNAAVVTLTFIVLVISIRQNTQSQKLVAVQSLTSAITAINVPAMESPAMGMALAAASSNWASATREQRIVAHYFLFCYFKLAEQAWEQHKARVLDDAQWAGWENGARMFYHAPGVHQGWWPHRRVAYSKGFQAYLEATAPSAGMGGLDTLFDPGAPVQSERQA
jgi:hypothetical protein